MIHLAIRAYAGKQLLFDDRIDVEEVDLDVTVPLLAEKHGAALAQHPRHMLEFEFLDEPDPAQRFFRIGTDPTQMVCPVELDLRKKRKR